MPKAKTEKKNFENRLKKVYLKEIETEELDFVLYDEIFKKGWEDQERGRDIIEKGKNLSWAGESIPISLTMLKKNIEQIEQAGATHIEIMHHSDHHSYVFYGLKITKATEEECETECKKEEERKKIEIEMEKLKTQFNKLAEKYQKI